ncbi:RNA-binding protein RO60-like isoform X2 [Phymastichus coffea]|nr:RNA-binding protein RO60-like isoform X2 [Phymastichus coffea]XP_058791737.1 RNA-binding protein RO60-like isoform X2 [Phymastichus coffea]
MPSDFNNSVLETQLRRFLYIGKEKPEYQPGNWFVHQYYLVKNIPSIDELAGDPIKHYKIVNNIVAAKNKCLVQNNETLVFALAVCAQQEKNHTLRKSAYDAVKIICDTPERFILFNKFCSQISKQKDNPKNGWGHGWRRAVKEWYLSKSPMELAKIVTQYKSRYGWKHKDIIKLAHVPTRKDGLDLVLKYVLYGLKKIKEGFEYNEQSTGNEELIKYFESIEYFKNCQDEIRVAALVESLNLTLDHIPGHMLKSEEVWNALVSSMNLTDLLKNLQRIHNLGFLKPNGIIVSKVIDIMSEKNVTDEKLHPAVFLVTLKNYENSGKPLSFEKRKVKEQAKRPLPPPPKVNKKIVDTLTKMLNYSFTTLQPTNVRYMITINMNKTMLDNGCWQCGNVNAAEAGCLIALSLLRAEKSVTVAIFTDNGIQCVDVDMNSTLVQMMRKLEPTNVEAIDLSKPMLWAAKENKSINVFINVVDQIYKKSDSSEEGIKAYREIMNIPKAKLVNCAMCASSTYDKQEYDTDILTVCGFDEKVPKIIEAFARSYF